MTDATKCGVPNAARISAGCANRLQAGRTRTRTTEEKTSAMGCCLKAC